MFEARTRFDAPHMVDDKGERKLAENPGKLGDIHGVQVHDQMPSERLNALENTAKGIHIGHAAQVLDEIEAHAPDPTFLQTSVISLGERLINNGDPAIATAAGGNGIEHRAVVRAMTARLNNHASLNAENFVQGRQALLGGIGGRIGAVGSVRKFRGRTEHMTMCVAGQ